MGESLAIRTLPDHQNGAEPEQGSLLDDLTAAMDRLGIGPNSPTRELVHKIGAEVTRFAEAQAKNGHAVEAPEVHGFHMRARSLRRAGQAHEEPEV